MEQINVLVTGGCGFLGTAIVSALLETKRFAITAVDVNPPSLGSSTFPTKVRYVRANILDLEALQKVLNEARPAIVVHAVGVYPLGAARYSLEGKDTVFNVNVEGTRNVLQAAKECGAKGLVYTSSVTVVLDKLSQDFKNVDESWPKGNVDTSYGLSKVRCCHFHSKVNSSVSYPICTIVHADTHTCLPSILLFFLTSHRPWQKTSSSPPPPPTSLPALCVQPPSSAPPTPSSYPPSTL